MYACMYVCMHVRMYVCMYVCMTATRTPQNNGFMNKNKGGSARAFCVVANFQGKNGE